MHASELFNLRSPAAVSHEILNFITARMRERKFPILITGVDPWQLKISMLHFSSLMKVPVNLTNRFFDLSMG